MVNSVHSLLDHSLIVVVGIALFLSMSACTSPSHDGVQGHLKADLPVAGTITFE